ncbi:MAG: hypothetical protein KDE56_25810 [Anaerolineales bacterium]|nr:hypothetical protein [Anaerolineales bacterium]
MGRRIERKTWTGGRDCWAGVLGTTGGGSTLAAACLLVLQVVEGAEGEENGR